MIRKTLFLFVTLACLWACNDDDEIGFDVPVEFRKELSFTPIPGGAIMKYYLPDNSDIFGVRVTYKDAWGYDITKEGTYLVDSLRLSGFNEAQQNVPAQVRFFNNAMEESAPIDVTFDTQDSAPVSFFDNLTVNSFWGGFSLSYTSPGMVDGMVHVLYVGTNPRTQQTDSILIMSTPIIENGDTLNFVLQQVLDEVTVVVRTEDYRGYRVKQEIFAGLPNLYKDTLDAMEFDFRFTGNIVTDTEYEFGEQYLFDGDKKGDRRRQHLLENRNSYQYSTFVAGPNAFGERFIIDLREPKVPASVNLYAYVNFGTNWPFPTSWYDFPALVADVWNNSYTSKLPCKVKMYGTNENPETVDLASCTLLYKLDQETSYAGWDASWAVRTDDYYSISPSYLSVTEAEYAAVQPVVLEMLCNYSGETYRYLIFVVEDTFNGEAFYESGTDYNTREYISFNELEVCVKAE